MENLEVIARKKVAFGWMGILMLVMVANFFFSYLDETVNRLMGTHHKRHFLLNRLFFMLWLMAVAILLSGPIFFNFFQKWVTDWGFDFPLAQFLTGNHWFFMICWLAFMILLLLVPKKRVAFKNVFFGGLIFALLIQLARFLFGLYTTNFLHRYNLIYGSLTTVIIAALWLTYFCNILLICVLWVRSREAPGSIIPSKLPSGS